MARILFLTDFFYPNATSIGVCVEKIVKEFKCRDNYIEVLCYGDTNKDNVANIDGINIHYVKYRAWDKLSKSTNKFIKKYGVLKIRLAQLTHIFSYPYISKRTVSNYVKRAESIFNNNNFDIIISSYAPFEAVMAAKYLKSKNNVFWTLYILDTFSNRGDSKLLSSKQNDKLGWRWEQILFEQADLILYMKCHEQHHKNKRYDIYRDKMSVVDIPLITSYEKDNINDNKDVNNKLVFSYTGRISEMYYSPSYWIKFLEKMHINNIDYKMYFCGSCDCEKLLDTAEEKTDHKIKYLGLVSQEKVRDIRNKSTVLINFGALNSEMIHSKIFEYMMSRKKIIHIQRGESDSSVAYLKKYPYILILHEKDSFEENYQKLIQFINRDLEENDWEKVYNRFLENKPEFTCDIIEEKYFQREK